MKINWKMLVAVIVHRRRRDRIGAQWLDPGPRCGRFEAVVAGGVPWRGERFR